MNVLFIGTTDILGGAAKVSFELMRTLKESGDTASMFVADKRSEDPSVHVIPRSTIRKYLSLALASDSVFSTDWILQTPEFKQADLVHCHNLHGRFFNLSTLVAMSKEKPVVWTLHDEWALTPHCAYTLEGTEMAHGLFTCPSKDTQPRILWDNTKRLVETKLQAYHDAQKLHVVAPSQWLLDRVELTTLRQHPHTLIRNGVDTKVFTRTDQSTARLALGLPLDKKIVLFLATAGKANTWKGWKHTQSIISAYRNRTDVHFLNVGNFVSIPPEGNIEYRDHVADQTELALYYSAADVLLFTSIAENFPLVILEAMSVGLPIAAFDVGGVAEAVRHQEHGYIARYQDEHDLKDGLEWLVALTPENRALMAERSMATARQFYDKSHMVAAYRTLYNSLTE